MDPLPCAFTNDDIRSRVHDKYQHQSDLDKFECTTVTAPLCHEGFCTSNKTIELFVKRKMATATPSAAAKSQSIWVLNGGPGLPQSEQEPTMVALYYTMNSTVNVYSLDHRGVGRSNGLVCDVPQLTMTLEQYPACIDKLLAEMDNNPVAYSVTSAAKDVEQLIANLNQNDEAFLYGGSYGSYWTERLMHLAPSTVKGYVLDGVIAEEEIDSALNDWNTNSRLSAQRLFEFCARSPECALKSTCSDKSLHDQLLQRFNELDKSPNECVKGINAKPSDFLRNEVIAVLLQMSHFEAIPYVLNLVFTCDVQAQKQLDKVLKALASLPPPPSPIEDKPEVAIAMMLGYLTMSSEINRLPMRSQSELDQQYHDSVIKACMFLQDQEKSDVCQSAQVPKSKPFGYKRDQFFNKTTKIPPGSSVLFLNGLQDFATPLEFGQAEFRKMQGDSKLWVQFDYGYHRVAASLETQTCAASIIGDFVTAHGAISNVDTSCVAAAPALDWSAKKFIQWVETATHQP